MTTLRLAPRNPLLSSLALALVALVQFASGAGLRVEPIAAGGGAVRDEGVWTVQAAPAGLAGSPGPALRIIPSEAVGHLEGLVVRATIQTDAPLGVVLQGESERGAREVFPVRAAPGGAQPFEALWSIEPRVGSPDPVTTFTLALASLQAPCLATVRDVRIDPRTDLTDEALLAASPFRPLSLRYMEPPLPISPQEAALTLPGELARRHEGQRVLLVMGGEPVEAFTLTMDLIEQDLYRRRLIVPLNTSAGQEREVWLALERADGTRLELGYSKFRVLPQERDFGQFEFQYHDIHDFTVQQSGPDLRIVTINDDLYAPAEPAALAISRHELTAHILSPFTGRSESETFWRVPSYGHWAEAGFRSLAMGTAEDATVLYATGVDGAGTEVMGLASTVGQSPLRAAAINPAWLTTGTLYGAGPDEKLALRAQAIAPYGDGHVMFFIVERADGARRLGAALTSTLRTWADAGPIPIDLPDELLHVEVAERGGVYYLFTDDPGSVWVSRDPLRNWDRRAIEFPPDWKRFRLAVFDAKQYLFGLSREYDRSVIRWRPLEWKDGGDGIQVPVLAVEDDGGSGI